MLRSERRGQRRDHAKDGGYRCDPDLAGKPMLQCIDFFAHRATVTDNAARPLKCALALRRKPEKPRSALHERDAQDFLKLLETCRHRRLRDTASFGRTPKVL